VSPKPIHKPTSQPTPSRYEYDFSDQSTQKKKTTSPIKGGKPKIRSKYPLPRLHHLLHSPNPQNPREISRPQLGTPAMSAPMEISFSAPAPPPEAACTVVVAPALEPAAAVSSPPPPQQQQAAPAAAVVAPSPADDKVLVSGERRRARVWASAKQFQFFEFG